MPTFEEAVLQIYRGLLDAGGVRSSLRAVAELLGGHVAALHDEDRSKGVSRVIASGLPEQQFAEFVADYQQRWAGANPWMEASMEALLREGVEHGDAVVNRRELESSDYYKQLLRPLNIEHSLGLRVAMDPPSRLAIATINRARCAGPFDGDSKQLALALRPHLECAYLLHRRLGMALAENDSLRAALDQVAVGFMLVEGDGRVLMVNATAAQTLERSDVAHLALSGRLVLKDRAAMDAWQRALASVDVSAGTVFEVRVFNPKSRTASEGAVLRMLPLAEPASAALIPGARWMVTVTELDVPKDPPLGFQSVLRSVFSLTPKEADVALAIRRYGTAPAAAKALSMATSTVRSHLKSLFDKMGIQRQTQLVQRLEQLMRG